MKNLLKFIYLIPFTGLFFSSSAQQNTVSSGGEATGSGGTASYSTGQTDYITTSGSGGTTTQGVQQPYEIFIATGVEETGIVLQASVFPNPAENHIILTVENPESEMNFYLYDNNGKLVKQEKIISKQTKIVLTEISNGIYFLRINNNEKEIKSFKIIKNK